MHFDRMGNSDLCNTVSFCFTLPKSPRCTDDEDGVGDRDGDGVEWGWRWGMEKAMAMAMGIVMAMATRR